MWATVPRRRPRLWRAIGSVPKADGKTGVKAPKHV